MFRVKQFLKVNKSFILSLLSFAGLILSLFFVWAVIQRIQSKEEVAENFNAQAANKNRSLSSPAGTSVPFETSVPQNPNMISQSVYVIIYDVHTLPGHTTFPYSEEYNPKYLVNMTKTKMEYASRFHGYGNTYDPLGQQIDFKIINLVTYITPSPTIDLNANGQVDSGEADYNKIINDNNLCLKGQDGRFVDEVWLVTDRTGGYWEAMMAGPADQIYNTNGPPLVRPDCPRPIHIMGFNYEMYYEYFDGRYIVPSVGYWLEDFGHRQENTIAHFLDNADRWATSGNWYEFTGPTCQQKGVCGNVHCPPNAIQNYQVDNHTAVTTDCEDWNIQHTGTKKTFACEEWGCSKMGYFIWWFQNMPGKCNGLRQLNDQPMPSWWGMLLKNTKDIYGPGTCPSLSPIPSTSPKPTINPVPTELIFSPSPS